MQQLKANKYDGIINYDKNKMNMVMINKEKEAKEDTNISWIIHPSIMQAAQSWHPAENNNDEVYGEQN